VRKLGLPRKKKVLHPQERNTPRVKRKQRAVAGRSRAVGLISTINTMILFKSICKTYKNGDIRALADVDAAIAEGEVFGLIGPNGAGKTTFIRLLLGLIEPSSGHLTRPDRWEPGSRELACVLDGDGVYPDMNIRDNLRFFGSLYDLPESTAEARGSVLLERFGLGMRMGVLVRRLSLGQRKIVSLCRAMLTGPTLLIVDELTAHLDPGNQRQLIEFLRELNKSEGTTVIFSSHDLHHVESLADHIVLIAGGTVRSDIRVDSIRDHVCYPISFRPEGADTLLGSLRMSSFDAFQEGPTTLRVLLRASEGREGDLEGIITSSGGLRSEPRAATLEDLYLARIGPSNAKP
jgi:ABC-2 type transport system ATP-binding protein